MECRTEALRDMKPQVEVFRQFHASEIGGHCGVTKTTDAIISTVLLAGDDS